MAPRTPPKNDFDPYALTKQVDDHAKDMASITKRLDDLEIKFGTHEQIADTLCVTAEKATKMQELLGNTFLKLICTDDKIKDGITKLINQADRKWVSVFLKRGGFAIWSAIVFLGGIAVKIIADKYSH